MFADSAVNGHMGTAKAVIRSGLGVPLILITLLAMVTLPVPAFLLDVLFTFNITLALVVLLVSVYALRPLDFAVFPTMLLVATLLRLSLNVASTRVVLLEGHEGGAAAGKVIEAFGDVLVGGNYVVGLVVFIILVIINFVVVTKGAGRISEVSARFTLDAMPGKQMAIDADLNAGTIDQEAARIRRAEVGQEADFYGSMDGASKFVKGDAVAGILILVINIVGGFAIGVAQHDLEFSQAIEVYTLLTIGDGLVAQIPSLLLSTAAAIMVTRVTGEADMGVQVQGQMFKDPRALGVASGILVLLGLVPDMPHLVFLSLGGAGVAMAWVIHQRSLVQPVVETDDDLPVETAAGPVELSWDDVNPVDVVGLEVGYRLIPLVDKSQGGELLSRIKGVRKKLSQDLGFLVPSVHIRDNLDLTPTLYRITLMGVTVGEAEIHPDMLLAINPGEVFGEVEGMTTTDPAFGLPAVWIDPGRQDHAQTLGYTVVDPGTVIATHLNHVLQVHSAELLGHDDVQQMVEMLARTSVKLSEELVPGTLTLGALLRVLQNLLQEQVPLRDFRSIAEALVEAGSRTKDPDMLTAAVRQGLGRMIVQAIYGLKDELPVITLEPELEQLLARTVQQAQQSGQGEDGYVIEPGLAQRLQASMIEVAQRQEVAGQPAVVLVSSLVRPMLARFVRAAAAGQGQPLLHVLAYQEVPDTKQITIVATVGA